MVPKFKRSHQVKRTDSRWINAYYSCSMVIKSCSLLVKDTETCVGSSLASYFVLFSLISLVSFYFVFISLISFRFVSFLLISFRFVSFRFRFALYRYPSTLPVLRFFYLILELFRQFGIFLFFIFCNKCPCSACRWL